MALINGGQVLVEVLRRFGVQATFTLHGGHLDAAYQAARDAGIRVVDTRHEQAAGFAASAFARSTGKVGVVMVTAGGGITLQGKRGVGSSDDIYFPGGNILANSGAIQLLGRSAGGRLVLENLNSSPTTLGAKNGTAVTSSSRIKLVFSNLFRCKISGFVNYSKFW